MICLSSERRGYESANNAFPPIISTRVGGGNVDIQGEPSSGRCSEFNMETPGTHFFMDLLMLVENYSF